MKTCLHDKEKVCEPCYKKAEDFVLNHHIPSGDYMRKVVLKRMFETGESPLRAIVNDLLETVVK